MKEVSPGIWMLGPFGPYRNACWILARGDEAAIVEMPSPKTRQARPWLAAKKTLKKLGLRAKYAFLSHAHVDHCSSIVQFREAFPQADFVAHRSVLDGRLRYQRDVFDHLFRGRRWTGWLGGEPVHIIYAPKHSYSDQMIVFRGAMLTGDWFLGDLKDCNALVPPGEKIRSIEALQAEIRSLDYHVHMMFSAHGDCLYYQVDFERMMERSKIDHDARALVGSY